MAFEVVKLLGWKRFSDFERNMLSLVDPVAQPPSWVFDNT
jgi:hypothetical protein